MISNNPGMTYYVIDNACRKTHEYHCDSMEDAKSKYLHDLNAGKFTNPNHKKATSIEALVVRHEYAAGFDESIAHLTAIIGEDGVWAESR